MFHILNPIELDDWKSKEYLEPKYVIKSYINLFLNRECTWIYGKKFLSTIIQVIRGHTTTSVKG